MTLQGLVWLAHVSEWDMNPHAADLHLRVRNDEDRGKSPDQRLAYVSEGGFDHYVHGLQQQVRLKTCS